MSSVVLLQFGSDPFSFRFEDLQGRPAFTFNTPPLWVPSNSFFYFGPRTSPGYIVYGNNPLNLPMSHLMRQERDKSSSRYFTSQSGNNYKWRMSNTRMECMDGRTLLASWDLSSPEDDFHARLTIKPSGLHIVTEIVTTLILNRMAQDLNWQ
ncbi:uncharacterized protein EV420DRAFT_1484810 [Desarmillaria tabescens]|uniref:DUF6593 domain-containing protein n=1 Tax=Armillaria tabescens TaxID=1929756 RepID=A0AA39MR24_ARMTA|nr:uncharacterized protein EV420DRAFT_1484810 [Desarmillaria tabescens]KAK0443926.1 hypothetical protein EV420DRAFT_1484810 [Desarmillaria tabescens]